VRPLAALNVCFDYSAAFRATPLSVTATGRTRLPKADPSLAKSHHRLDSIVLSRPAASHSFIIDAGVYRNPILNPTPARRQLHPDHRTQAKDGMREASPEFAPGNRLLFPEGELTRTGTLLRLRRGYESSRGRPDAPVVPGLARSNSGARSFVQADASLRNFRRPFRPGHGAFGKPLPADDADIPTLREHSSSSASFVTANGCLPRAQSTRLPCVD